MGAPRIVVPTDHTVRVTTRSGSITVIGEDRPDVSVEGGTETVTSGAEGVEVTGRSGSITIRCPAGSDLFVGTASGSVTLEGRLGRVHVTTKSGKIEIDRVERADARTNSGSIDIDDCEGECRCCSGTGSIRVGRAGSVDLVAASGSVEAGEVGTAKVHVGNGSVALGVTAVDFVEVDAHSGSVTIAVPEGSHPATDLRAERGAVRCDCVPGDDGSIRVNARSGSISVIER